MSAYMSLNQSISGHTRDRKRVDTRCYSGSDTGACLAPDPFHQCSDVLYGASCVGHCAGTSPPRDNPDRQAQIWSGVVIVTA